MGGEAERVKVLRTLESEAEYEQILVTPAYTRTVEQIVQPAEYDDDGKITREAATELVPMMVDADYRGGAVTVPAKYTEERIVTPAVEAGDLGHS